MTAMSADEEGQEIVAIWRLLWQERRMGAVALVEWRCPDRCLLAQAFQLPGRQVLVTTAYKLSPKVNEAGSTPTARALRTSDGDRRWRARGYDLQSLADADAGLTQQHLGAVVNCAHVLERVLTGTRLAEDVRDVTPGSPRTVVFP